jgi:hypothetical protein
MMPSVDLKALAAETAFERLALEEVYPLIPRVEDSSTIDTRGERESVSVTPAPATIIFSLVDGSRPADLRVLQPLCFGAAWKILDLIFEKTTGERTIAGKKAKARGLGVPAPAPWGGHQAVWERIEMTYANTVDLRHSLVHRELSFDSQTGEICGTGRSPGLPMSAAEIESFCRMSLGVVDAILLSKVGNRALVQVQWMLRALGRHHCHLAPLTPTASLITGVIPELKIDLDLTSTGGVRIDAPALLARGHRNMQSDHFDVEASLPDGRVLAFELEDAADHGGEISLTALPSWLSWR